MTLKSSIMFVLAIVFAMLLISCNESSAFSVNDKNSETGRWYSEQLKEQGQLVYQDNCLACHKAKARGIPDWKKPVDGGYPPPPLNGSAHAWHHSLPVLLKTIDDGGIPVGGKMPPFKDVLTQQEKISVVAYFQSFWPDEIYQRWVKAQ